MMPPPGVAQGAEDRNGDGVPDDADNCPRIVNPGQEDADGVGDACDGCPSTHDRAQRDIDRDGTGDACDGDDGLVLFAAIDRVRVNWQSDPAFATYDLYRGALAVLLATGAWTQAPGSNPYAGRFCGVVTTFQDDSLTPFAGEALYWLVGGVGASGEEPLGHGDDVVRDNAAPCP